MVRCGNFPCLLSNNFTHAAPSAPPTSVSVSMVNSTAIAVQWGPVDCIHRNGDIIGYTVQYGRKTVSISGDAGGGMYVLSGLMPSSIYSIRVAAETSAGVGNFSDSVIANTGGKKATLAYLSDYILIIL